MSTKEEFMRGVRQRAEAREDEEAYWSYVYRLINGYTPEMVDDFNKRAAINNVTEQEIKRHRAYCAFEGMSYARIG